MTIAVQTCDIQIGRRELGLTRDRFTQSILRQYLEDGIFADGWTESGPFPTPPDIQRLVDIYAERLASGANADIQNYFGRLASSGFTPGGKRVTSHALLYLKSRLLPSAEVIGAVGEGIAGYYLEGIAGLQFELRPLGVSPDFVFVDPANNKKALVEVKASLHRESGGLSVPLRLIEVLAKTKFVRAGDYLAYVVYVTISGPTDFQLRVLRLEEV